MSRVNAEGFGAVFDTAVSDLTTVQDKVRNAAKAAGLAVVEACEKSVASAVASQQKVGEAGVAWAAETIRTQTGLAGELNAASAAVMRDLLI